MKLHLPCALRGALLACFALACTVPAWAEDFEVSSSDDIVFTSGSQHTLTPAAGAENIAVSSVKIKEQGTLTIGAGFERFTIESLQVDSTATSLVVEIAAGTTVYLNEVKFYNTKVTYVLGEGATLVISADDCTEGSISTSGSATVLFDDGVIDGTKASIAGTDTENWFPSTAFATTGGFQPSDVTVISSKYTSSGTISYDLYTVGTKVEFNAQGGKGTIEKTTSSYDYVWDGKGSGSHKPAGVESTLVAVIDRDKDIYRANGVWHLHYTAATADTAQKGKETISVSELNSNKLGDFSASTYTKLGENDTLLFEGSTLTCSSADGDKDNPSVVTLENPIAATAGFKVSLAPAANMTLRLTQGAGALTGDGLVLSGGSGSTVELWGITVDTPNKIEFTTENTTLGLAGQGTITIDGGDATNKIKDSSSFKKLDGGTLIYKAEANDTIKNLSVTGGVARTGNELNIESSTQGNPFTLNVQKLSADTVNIAQNGSTVIANTITAGTLNVGDNTADSENISVTADTITAGDVNIAQWTGAENRPTLTVNKTLTATGNVTLNPSSIVNAAGATVSVTGDLTMNGGTTFNVGTLKVAGTTTVPGYSLPNTPTRGIITDNFIVNGDKAVATFSNLNITGNKLSASGANKALINLKQAGTVSLGKATESKIDAVAGSTISNTVFTDSTIIGNGNLTLKGSGFQLKIDQPLTDPSSTTTIDPGTTLKVIGADATLTLTEVAFIVGNDAANLNGFTVGATTADATDGGSYITSIDPNGKSATQLILSGTATKDTLTLSNVVAYIEGSDEIDTPVVLMEGVNGEALAAAAGGFTYTGYTDPGMVAYLSITNNQLVYTLRDESDKLIDQLVRSSNMQSAATILFDNAQAGGQDELRDLYDYLRNQSRATFEDRQAVLEAIASGSITMMADSQRLNVTNTLNNLRNRIIQMGNPQGIEPDKKIHAWISADGSNNDVDQDGAYAGYEYQTWGGTVGLHADVNNFSFGAALSAAYGDLTSHGADRAEGDHDTVALSGFVRHQSGAWTQMGILSLGRNEIELERSITTTWTSGDTKTYTSRGDASGHTISAYYELGYTFTLGEEETQLIQPMVSLSLTSARMGDYRETGSIGNAGLCKDTEDYFYGTVGIGARYQIVLGTNVENRLCFAEARVKLVQDFGDKTNECGAWFVGTPTQNFNMKGADVSRTGFQFGAGISVPVGVYTTLFADADADIRSGSTSYCGSVGMRVEF